MKIRKSVWMMLVAVIFTCLYMMVPAVADETAAEDADTVGVEETMNESGEDVVTASGLYEVGRQWADEHPELFQTIVWVLGMVVYGGVQLIGYFRVRKPVVRSSNNAVEMYQNTAEQIRAVNKDAENRIREANRLTEETVQQMQEKMESAVKVAVQAVAQAQVKTEEQTQELVRSREAVLLMSRVVGRLLEESSLPARTRDEIHALVQEAEDKMKEENHGTDAAEL